MGFGKLLTQGNSKFKKWITGITYLKITNLKIGFTGITYFTQDDNLPGVGNRWLRVKGKEWENEMLKT